MALLNAYLLATSTQDLPPPPAPQTEESQRLPQKGVTTNPCGSQDGTKVAPNTHVRITHTAECDKHNRRLFRPACNT